MSPHPHGPPSASSPAIGAGIDEAGWSDLGRFAARLCDADAAGVGRAFARPAIAWLAGRIARGGAGGSESAMIHDAASDTHLAAAALGRDPAAGLLWVERRARFDRAALARLRWLAAGGLDLFHVLDAEREQAELLLRENRHRFANDLHLVGSLLSHQARFADDPGARDALANVAARVMTLVRARQMPDGDLAAGLRACVDALTAQVGGRGITVGLRVEGECPPIEERRATVLLIAVNELATNAIKHAFIGRGDGRVEVTLSATANHIRLTVEDDGASLDTPGGGRVGSGLDLVRRLIGGVRGEFAVPPARSKCFTIDMPVALTTHDRRDR
jgi:two-component sensor histidine kinase